MATSNLTCPSDGVSVEVVEDVVAVAFTPVPVAKLGPLVNYGDETVARFGGEDKLI
jgi:hypothetical protein